MRLVELGSETGVVNGERRLVVWTGCIMRVVELGREIGVVNGERAVGEVRLVVGAGCIMLPEIGIENQFLSVSE